MKKVLFVNACVREESRTRRLADEALALIGGRVSELCLERERIMPLDSQTLRRRDLLIEQGKFDDPLLKYAAQFARSDIIVIAAPYWDLSFPALLKIYLEAINVSGLTFKYVNDTPRSLCSAQKLIYVTTSGGVMEDDFAFSYIAQLAKFFYQIPDVLLISAQGLDIAGADVQRIMADSFRAARDILS